MLLIQSNVWSAYIDEIISARHLILLKQCRQQHPRIQYRFTLKTMCVVQRIAYNNAAVCRCQRLAWNIYTHRFQRKFGVLYSWEYLWMETTQNCQVLNYYYYLLLPNQTNLFTLFSLFVAYILYLSRRLQKWHVCYNLAIYFSGCFDELVYCSLQWKYIYTNQALAKSITFL